MAPATEGARYDDGRLAVARIGRYDSDLQMFVEEPRDARRVHLRFLRWLVERQGLEHPVSGPPSGSFAEPGASSRREEGLRASVVRTVTPAG